MAHPGQDGRTIRCAEGGHFKAPEEYLCRWRIGRKSGSFQNGNNHSPWSDGWQGTNKVRQHLQSRCYHRSRLPHQLQKGDHVPHLGDASPEGIHNQGLRHERRAPEGSAELLWQGLLRGAARTHPRNPCLRTQVLPEDYGYLCGMQRRLRPKIGSDTASKSCRT